MKAKITLKHIDTQRIFTVRVYGQKEAVEALMKLIYQQDRYADIRHETVKE